MLYIPTQQRGSTWRKPLIILIAAAGFVAAVVSVAPSNTSSRVELKTLSIPMDVPLTALHVEIPNEPVQRTGQRFSGRYLPGQVCYLPASATFEIETEPVGAAGSLVELGPNGSWAKEGGDISPPMSRSEYSIGSIIHCRAPRQPGLYRLLWQPPIGAGIRFDMLVLANSEISVQGDRTIVKVNGKSIGAYLDPTQAPVRRVRENAQQYKIPRYFAALTPDTTNLQLGPDFDLGQLVAFKDYHGPDGKKVFTNIRHTDVLPLKPELIHKLIKLRERLREKGVKITRFWITSGFRTPEYNRSIGGAAYSRHCYGDAVDICIDEDDDKHMDDLNGDGKIDRKDGIVIANACRELEAEGAVVPGGIGVYEWDGEDSVRSHVHIDCRGYITRWGQVGQGRYRKSFTWWPKAEFQEDENGE